MTFWQKIKASFAQFMAGRHGADQMSMGLFWTGLAFYLLDMFLRTGLLSTLGLAVYIYAMFRMFSRNREKRAAENVRYLALRTRVKATVSQFFNRVKNSRQFKYFRCPQCGARLRVPRGVGQITITCSQCKHAFKGKA